MNWPKGQLYYGASSLAETWDGVVASSFYQLSPRFLQRYPWAGSTATKQTLAVLLIAVMIAALIDVLRKRFRDSLGFSSHRRRILMLAGLLAGTLVLTIAVHFAAFRIFGLLLPKDRTALYFVPLVIMTAGALLAAEESALRFIGTTILLLHGFYFIGCLRQTYFMEWQFNSDSRQIYDELDRLVEHCGSTDYLIDWRYVGVLNFYRQCHRNNAFLADFIGAPFQVSAYPIDKKVFVLYEPDAREFITQHRLNKVYCNSKTNAVIAIQGCQAR